MEKILPNDDLIRGLCSRHDQTLPPQQKLLTFDVVKVTQEPLLSSSSGSSLSPNGNRIQVNSDDVTTANADDVMQRKNPDVLLDYDYYKRFCAT